jgi:hypothetical protein
MVGFRVDHDVERIVRWWGVLILAIDIILPILWFMRYFMWLTLKGKKHSGNGVFNEFWTKSPEFNIKLSNYWQNFVSFMSIQIRKSRDRHRFSQDKSATTVTAGADVHINLLTNRSRVSGNMSLREKLTVNHITCHKMNWCLHHRTSSKLSHNGFSLIIGKLTTFRWFFSLHPKSKPKFQFY